MIEQQVPLIEQFIHLVMANWAKHIAFYGEKKTSKREQKNPRYLWSASELYRLSDRHLSMKFSANFCGLRGVAWSERRIPYGR
jgi:hypothetical protein